MFKANLALDGVTKVLVKFLSAELGTTQLCKPERDPPNTPSEPPTFVGSFSFMGPLPVWAPLPVRAPSLMCGLQDFNNRTRSISWPQVVKGIPSQGVDCFIS